MVYAPSQQLIDFTFSFDCACRSGQLAVERRHHDPIHDDD